MRTGLKVALIDYNMGNLRSVSKALEAIGANVEWVRSPSGLNRFNAMILPGVGAFSVAVHNLKKQKLFDAIQKWILSRKPFFGICLGYQLLFEKSEESNSSSVQGLNVFRGNVVRFPKKLGLKVPHIGWNQIQKKSKSVLNNIDNQSYFYFVHSYYPVPKDPTEIATTTRYGVEFASSVARDNLFACQFHPEKSGKSGLKLLKNIFSKREGGLC